MSALSRSGPESERSPGASPGNPGSTTPAQRRHEEEEAEADDLEMTSPEGRPADPGVRAKTTIVLVAIAIGVVIVAAALIARAGSPWMAAGVALAGFIFVLVFNPIVWASVLRVREREEVHHEHENASRGG